MKNVRLSKSKYISNRYLTKLFSKMEKKKEEEEVKDNFLKL